MRKRLFSIAAVAASCLAVAPAAHADGLLTDQAQSCDSESLSQVFLPWVDVSNYTVAPGGNAESGSGWSLNGGAAIAPGNEPWYVNSTSDSNSVKLPAGSSATSGAICVGLDHPTLRTFVRSTGTNLLSSLRVDVNYRDGAGNQQTLPLGLALPTSGNWQATTPMVILPSVLSLLDGKTNVSFRFVPQGAGTWQVDDVYVDPWSNR